MTNDFNGIARWYQFLSRAVFGKKLIQAQVVNLCYLEKNQKVLIVGGGDGELLKYIPSDLNLTIDYVDLSDSMIELAKPKAQGLNIKFFSGNILDHSGHYDVVIANFFFDCFDEFRLPVIAKHLLGCLEMTGKLLVTDFAAPKSTTDKLLLYLMYQFFGLTTNLEAIRLQNLNTEIIDTGARQISYKEQKRPRVFMAVYRPI